MRPPSLKIGNHAQFNRLITGEWNTTREGDYSVWVRAGGKHLAYSHILHLGTSNWYSSRIKQDILSSPNTYSATCIVMWTVYNKRWAVHRIRRALGADMWTVHNIQNAGTQRHYAYIVENINDIKLNHTWIDIVMERPRIFQSTSLEGS